MQRAEAELDRGRDEATQDQTLAEGRVVAGNSATATTDPERDGRSACDLWCAGEAVRYIELAVEVQPSSAVVVAVAVAVVAQKAAEPVQALAGRPMSGIAAGLQPVRSLPALDRQPRRRLADQKLPYQMARANAALMRNCRQIGATDSTWSMGS